jgi:hypothetical protein
MDIRQLFKLSNWSHVHTLVCVGSDVAKNLVHYSRRASGKQLEWTRDGKGYSAISPFS